MMGGILMIREKATRGLLAALSVIVLLLTPIMASAVQKVVLFEEFGAIW